MAQSYYHNFSDITHSNPQPLPPLHHPPLHQDNHTDKNYSHPYTVTPKHTTQAAPSHPLSLIFAARIPLAQPQTSPLPMAATSLYQLRYTLQSNQAPVFPKN